MEEVFARFVWLAIPLEYFVLTRFSGGLDTRHGVAVTLVALLALLAVPVVSLGLSAIPRPSRTSYEERVRIWSFSLVLSWSAALRAGADLVVLAGPKLVSGAVNARCRLRHQPYGRMA